MNVNRTLNRSLVAEVLNLEEEKIKCKNCNVYEKSNRCHLWDCYIGGEEFCSMFELKEETHETANHHNG